MIGSLVVAFAPSRPTPHWTRPPYMGGGRTPERTSAYLGHARGAARLGRGGETLIPSCPFLPVGFFTVCFVQLVGTYFAW